MLESFGRIRNQLKFVQELYALNALSVKAIVFFPIVISLLYLLLVVIPQTRSLAIWMQEENRPIELITFGFLIAGGAWGLILAYRTKARNEVLLVYGFYAVFSCALLVVAMEEIAWGQWFFGFETPSALKKINVQGEFTIHNIRGLHGKAEFFRAAFGLGGLLGVWLSYRGNIRRLGASLLLLPWFLVISCQAIPDLYVEFFSKGSLFDKLLGVLSELIEMLIAISGFLYVWLNARVLATTGESGATLEARFAKAC